MTECVCEKNAGEQWEQPVFPGGERGFLLPVAFSGEQ